jgi:NRPS condensation-like uncharacterized protein
VEAIGTKAFNRKLGVERPMLMLPLNVVMMGRVRGTVDTEVLISAIKAMKNKHPLLSIYVKMNEEGEAWFCGNRSSEIDIQLIPRENKDQWMQFAIKDSKKMFDVGKGPLIRFSVLCDKDGFDLVLCAHHMICDGLSINYLIRDILEYIKSSSNSALTLVEPPEINQNTVVNPPTLRGIPKLVIRLINWIWRKKKIRFSLEELSQLNSSYWEKNQGVNLLSWSFTLEETSALLTRCRAENVTVNTALWAAFLAVQEEIQGKKQGFRNRAGMAVSVRDKMRIKVGEAFGFYASSLTVMLKNNSNLSFWEMARCFQKRIEISLRKTNPFKMLISNAIDPGLIDSLYFSKYGLIENKMSKKFLKKMMWDKLNYGFSLTNVGRVNIPVSYGKLELDCVYGPIVYSDVNEKTVGVTTVGNKMTFVLTHKVENIDKETAGKIKNSVIQKLSEAIK